MASSFAIPEVKALVRQPRRDHAQQLLERLATAVLPIMTQRRFRVHRLIEFFPKDGSLLGMNVNHGAKIYIRLRHKRTPESFLPYEALLETLLHELTHMVHGPHNQAFYQYLDELKAEMESLMVRGLEGEEGVKFAAAGEGQRLGGSNTSVSIRFAAVLAAKRREQYNLLLGGETSRRLGAATTTTNLSNEVLNPQTLRSKVSEAAERRRKDNEHCRNVLHEGASHEVLGIESSDNEDDEGSGTSTVNGSRVSRQQALGANMAEPIILDDVDDLPLFPRIANRAADSNVPTIIDLLNEDESEEKSDAMSEAGTQSRARSLPNQHSETEQDRKRQRQDKSEIIDLT